MAVAPEIVETLQAKFDALLPHLDERGQRLTLAAEARSLGHGGIAAVARAAGASRSRVQRGVAELERGEEPTGRVRRRGAGRKPVTQTDPGRGRVAVCGGADQARGSAESALCWTTLSLKRLVDSELAVLGHTVSTWTVANLLRAQGFSLQANRKTREGGQHPDRNAQFEHINAQRQAFQQRGQPVSRWTPRRRNWSGDFKNGGASGTQGRA